MESATQIDDQPISATFFGEGKWLTSFITPQALEVKELYEKLTEAIDDSDDKILACWNWVANEIKYVRFVKAKIWVEGHSSSQKDYWQAPSQLIQTRVGNCVNKALLLTSLLRNEISTERVFCVLGNLCQEGNSGGHSWVELRYNSHGYILESTRGDMQPMVNSDVANIYEPVIYFNDKEVSAIEGRTVLEPFTAVYATWLKDYLDWVFIEGNK